MKLLLSVLFAVALQPSLSSAADAEPADGNGRYEGIAASANAVWVVDTRTGRVRKCTQEFADQTPNCSKMSN
ncbi:MAG: hypothetical protein KDI82_16495 [Gammaproteobacteria bacterium]|nr:hypothetical protein [Gammaproteobacteria bacterium]